MNTNSTTLVSPDSLARLIAMRDTVHMVAASTLPTIVLRDRVRRAGTTLHEITQALGQWPCTGLVTPETVRKVAGALVWDGYALDDIAAALRRFDRSEFSSRVRHDLHDARRLLMLLAEVVGNQPDQQPVLLARAVRICTEPQARAKFNP